MLRAMDDSELSVTALAAPFSMSLAAASKHVRTLEQAGLIRRTIQGRTHRCRIDTAPLAEAMAWLRHYEKFWKERLDDLERELRRPEAEPETGDER
jgi:DNA-binding transcriptional ArsR family regulator